MRSVRFCGRPWAQLAGRLPLSRFELRARAAGRGNLH